MGCLCLRWAARFDGQANDWTALWWLASIGGLAEHATEPAQTADTLAPGRTLARGPAESYGEVAGREMPES